MFDLEKAIGAWLRQFRKHRAFDHGSIREMELHLRDHIEDLVTSGINEKEAFQQAVKAFGEITEVAREEFQTMRPVRRQFFSLRSSMVGNYLKIASRNFTKQPFFTFLNTFGLAIGITGALLITLFVQGELNFDKMFANSDRIYRINIDNRSNGENSSYASAPGPMGSGGIICGVNASRFVVTASSTVARRRYASGSCSRSQSSFGGHLTFAPQVETLASAGYRAVAWDMPGYGNSAPIEPYTFKGLAQSCLALIDALQGGPVVLVGHGMGAMVALEAAVRRPSAVRRMVLCAGGPALDSQAVNDWVVPRQRALQALDARGGMEQLAQMLVPQFIGTGALPEGVRLASHALSQVYPGAYRRALEALPTFDRGVDALGLLNLPTLLVSGGSPYGGRPSEAELGAELLSRDFDVAVRWQESGSRNTWENALFSARLLERAGVRRIVLVTSAAHMPRALWCFERNGLEVVAAPVGFFGGPTRRPLGGWLPEARAVGQSGALLNEAAGRLLYPLLYGNRSGPGAAAQQGPADQ